MLKHSKSIVARAAKRSSGAETGGDAVGLGKERAGVSGKGMRFSAVSCSGLSVLMTDRPRNVLGYFREPLFRVLLAPFTAPNATLTNEYETRRHFAFKASLKQSGRLLFPALSF